MNSAKKFYIDINCDVGEGVGNEADLFPLITRCNIACGGHAGDTQTIRKILELAKPYGLKTGAHPSYPDPENFGRNSMNLSPRAFKEAIRAQLNTFMRVVGSGPFTCTHIKAHGALYNDLARNEDLAHHYIRAIRPFAAGLQILVPPGSVLEGVAREYGLETLREAFLDRTYCEDGSLRSRKEKDALIQIPERVAEQLQLMVEKKQVRTFDHKIIPLQAETYCIHGDTPRALEILMYLSSRLSGMNMYLDK